ncbi:hypothetical protein CLV59_103631 [Chitinophaga dinghuensis]|uniref:Uncharacterized protein n=1 Tax=Chitinophaga dinghuensis TaxID=1539050 RepID=A0A327W5N5_9BACT|nr:hypothetical protein [Chitinophaga dinghuensis]RAJ83660.1 hypothetical protein CLV59_103631 [Chitinophaga dinghuensis]
MIDEALQFDKWYAPSTEEILAVFKNPSESKKLFKAASWKNFKGELSPVDAYKYLKARFGEPNGLTMIGKVASLDNVIHWHYTIWCDGWHIEFYGHSSGMEIMINSSKDDVTDEDREKFVAALKGDFKHHGKEIRQIQNGFEKWTLFINPYVRLSQTIDELFIDLRKIELKEPVAPVTPSPKSAYTEYTDQVANWIRDITKAAAIGTTIRMLLPVVAESFVNLVIYILRKQEYIEDDRMFDALIRNQIDIRVKSLHVHCDGFDGAVNGKDPRFAAFHTLMNKRNDYLHGNINPSAQKVDTVLIDNLYTPLFEHDESILKRMMAKYPVGVTLEDVENDYAVVNGLIDLVLENLNQPSRDVIDSLLRERFPGINEKTKKIATLVPNRYAEGIYIIEPKANENPDYQLFLEKAGSFLLYIPSDWTHEIQKDRHLFRPVKFEKSEQLLLSMKKMEALTLDQFNQYKRERIGNHEFYAVPAMMLEKTLNLCYFTYIDNYLVHFTYTKALEEEGKLPKSMSVPESIIGSFGFVAEESRESLIEKYHYENFVKGLAAVQQLIHNSIKNEAFFETATLLLSEIEAMIRLALAFSRKLNGEDKKLNINLLYQEKVTVQKDIRELIEEAYSSEVISKKLRDSISSLVEHRSILDNFIITSTALWEVENYARDLSHASGEINKVIGRLEQQLTESGLMSFSDPDKEQFYRYYIKSKIGG